MSLAEVKKWFACTCKLKSPSRRGLASVLCVLATSVSAHTFAANAETPACPDLRPYYPASNPASQQEWAALLPQLENLMPSCLESAEFFALFGAAQLNNGQIANAMESLERALLLDPNNGAAQIDYAETLYISGQLLPALEMNSRLLSRPDLPPNLAAIVNARQESWQRMTFQKQFQLEASAGYDSNLNGAPTRSDLTLILNGVPVAATLDPQYRPLEGAFANVRLSGFWRKLQPAHTHDLFITGRARTSAEGDTDLAQADWRYTFGKSIRRHRWEAGGGTSHLMFGGSPLYSITEFRGRYTRLRQGCQPSGEATVQHLLYHGQSLMNGLESSLSVGLGCAFSANQQWLLEGGYLNNHAVKSNRPGGTRDGWQLRLNWQYVFGPHQLNAQISYTELHDENSYSPILANGAIRNVENRFAAIRYKRELTEEFFLLLNVNHQDQKSNLEPFNNRGTVAEAGLSFVF